MRYNFNTHPGVDEMENYLIGHSSRSENEEMEEHLLICERCQDAFQELEANVIAMRAACAQAEQKRLRAIRPLRSWWKFPVPVPAFATACTLLLAGGVTLHYWTSDEPAQREVSDVTLTATRGLEGEASRTAVAGAPVLLHLDTTALPALPQYTVQIVDQVGSTVWQRAAKSDGSTVNIQVDQKIPAGRYWVRLNAPDGSALREFDLTVR